MGIRIRGSFNKNGNSLSREGISYSIAKQQNLTVSSFKIQIILEHDDKLLFTTNRILFMFINGKHNSIVNIIDTNHIE